MPQGDENAASEGGGDSEGYDRQEHAAYGIAALYADAYFLNSWKGHIRIAFGEYLGGVVRHRTAVVLEVEDAESLSADLAKMAKHLRDRAIVAP